ncbi:MAG: DEAD/DEAH box helicase, partial [Kofleriaceae bacterium]
MTNDTTLHENGAAEDPAAIAAITAEQLPTDPVAAQSGDAAAAPVEPEPKAPSFDDLGLHPDVKQALDDMGYFAPTPVQTAVYVPVSQGKDLLVQSRTGTGKTTAFGLPVINNLIPTHRAPQALILTPTRELALQVQRELTQIGKHRGILVEPIYGGAPIGKQITNLNAGVHVIVGTPGRVLDHIGRRTLDCRTIQTFILDECDEMLSMGFLEDIERVVSHLPEKKQTLLFSATMPDEVSRYARRHMRAPEQISLSRDSISVSDIHHAYYIVSGIARSRDLLKVIYAEEPESAIIFCNMRDETTMVAKFLQKQGLDAEPLSSDLSQADRERVMGRMKQKDLRFLCATDVAARGIDISNLSHVINYSVPESPEIYVHRTGRTGRAGRKGTALSLVGPRELGNFRYVRLTFGIKPEERLLPKDEIFVGKLKHPLPPVGTPQPPDPVQILIRGVAGTPTDLQRQIFEKLYATAAGKRVLAQLVADKLDKLSTRAKPKREPSVAREPDAEARPTEEVREPRGDGERSFDRDRGRRREGRDERPRFRDDRGPRGDGDRGPRPEGARFDGPDRGPRPEGDRGPRPEGDRGPRPEGDR